MFVIGGMKYAQTYNILAGIPLGIVSTLDGRGYY
jgi:hypothetical protein